MYVMKHSVVRFRQIAEMQLRLKIDEFDALHATSILSSSVCMHAHMHTRVAYCYRSLFIPHPQKITVPQTAKLCALNLFGWGNEL